MLAEPAPDRIIAAMTAPWRSRATLLVAGGLVVWYAVALLVVPSRFMTTDAAKYVGVGRNMLTGAGPVTSFGTFFPYHSPTWPIVVMGPETLAGIDWALWSRFLNIAGAVAVVAMTGYLAWRFSPRAALLAVALIVAFRYGFELARTLGLDEAASCRTGRTCSGRTRWATCPYISTPRTIGVTMRAARRASRNTTARMTNGTAAARVASATRGSTSPVLASPRFCDHRKSTGYAANSSGCQATQRCRRDALGASAIVTVGLLRR